MPVIKSTRACSIYYFFIPFFLPCGVELHVRYKREIVIEFRNTVYVLKTKKSLYVTV